MPTSMVINEGDMEGTPQKQIYFGGDQRNFPSLARSHLTLW